MLFRELNAYEGLTFANVETANEDVERNLKILGSEANQEPKGATRVR
jgi:hypothetical protein